MSVVHDRPDPVAALEAFCHVDDPDIIRVNIAAAATSVCAGDPVWIMNVGPPSSGKTEALRALDYVVDAHMDEVTAAGLMSWKPARGKQPARPTGVLTRIGNQATITVGDFSTLLASSDKGLRDQLFALLRRAYDGHVVRELGNAPEPLEWRGRLTVLAAVTPAIDNYSAHNSALGDRWLYFRLPERTAEDRRSAMEKAQVVSEDIDRHRAGARNVFAAAVNEARLLMPGVESSATALTRIQDIAIVVTVGRADVPRNGYGKREIIGEAVREEPMRLAKQLSLLHRGLLATGVEDVAALRIVQRVGLDTMPVTRSRVLSELAAGERLTASEIGRLIGSDRKVVRFALEELALVGVCRYEGYESDYEEEANTARKRWALHGDDGALIARIFGSERKLRHRDRSGTKSGDPPPISPQEQGEGGGNSPPFVPRVIAGEQAEAS